MAKNKQKKKTEKENTHTHTTVGHAQIYMFTQNVPFHYNTVHYMCCAITACFRYRVLWVVCFSQIKLPIFLL
uniref:Uncharacterized protein n=1 Tax=Anguilla anguilla TaxID=7936 RepID=A0A0E9XU29_ANGAN